MVCLDAFGMRVVFEFELVAGLGRSAPPDSPADLRVRLGTQEELSAAWGRPAGPVRSALRSVDGLTLRVERSADELVRWTWEEQGAWLLDRDRSVITAWAPSPEPGPAWQRVLLDSVLASVALVRGGEALHAAAAVGDDGTALAIVAGTGGGKTSLLAELLERGWALLADDVVVFRDGDTRAWPAPPVINLPRSRRAEPIGAILAELGDEHWTLVAIPASAPADLGTVVILERVANASQVDVTAASGLTLLPHVLDSGADKAREAARFTLCADLGEQATVLVCRAPLTASPAQLADAVTRPLPPPSG